MTLYKVTACKAVNKVFMRDSNQNRQKRQLSQWSLLYSINDSSVINIIGNSIQRFVFVIGYRIWDVIVALISLEKSKFSWALKAKAKRCCQSVNNHWILVLNNKILSRDPYTINKFTVAYKTIINKEYYVFI